MFVMLLNLSVISHWIFPQYFFLFLLFLVPNLIITKEATYPFKRTPIKKKIFFFWLFFDS